MRSSGAAAESVGRLSCVTELPKLRESQAAGRKRGFVVSTLNIIRKLATPGPVRVAESSPSIDTNPQLADNAGFTL